MVHSSLTSGPLAGILRVVTSYSYDSPIAELVADQPNATKRVMLLKPRGFCAGVVRAVDIVRIALETFGAPIYVRKEIVHNSFVVNELAEKGAIFRAAVVKGLARAFVEFYRS